MSGYMILTTGKPTSFDFGVSMVAWRASHTGVETRKENDVDRVVGYTYPKRKKDAVAQVRAQGNSFHPNAFTEDGYADFRAKPDHFILRGVPSMPTEAVEMIASKRVLRDVLQHGLKHGYVPRFFQVKNGKDVEVPLGEIRKLARVETKEALAQLAA